MHVFSRVALGLAVTAVSATALAAQTTASTGNREAKILFTRRTLAQVPGESTWFPTAVGMYMVDADGGNLRTIKPLEAGHYFIPGLESDTTVWGYEAPVDWLSRNVSNQARHILYFDGLSSAFPTLMNDLGGKYRIKDPDGHSHALFPGTDDVTSGFGFVTWGPPGSQTIAYTNTAKNNPASPACVFLVRPDGSNAHTLWCAASHGTATSVSNLRWSGDGKSLLAYVNWNLEYGPNWGTWANTELWRISTVTGQAMRISGNISQPGQGNSADISYDGSKVIYEEDAPYDQSSPRCQPDYQETGGGSNVCAWDMTTGTIRVVGGDPAESYLQLLISPGGGRYVYGEYDNPPGSTSSEQDLFLLSTKDGSVVRQLTHRPASGLPDGAKVVWRAVAWSRNGKHLLANRFYLPPHVPNEDKPAVPDIYVINLANGTARHVIRGRAEDWYTNSP